MMQILLMAHALVVVTSIGFVPAEKDDSGIAADEVIRSLRCALVSGEAPQE